MMFDPYNARVTNAQRQSGFTDYMPQAQMPNGFMGVSPSESPTRPFLDLLGGQGRLVGYSGESSTAKIGGESGDFDPYSLRGADEARLRQLVQDGTLQLVKGEKPIEPGMDATPDRYAYSLGGGQYQGIRMGPNGAIVEDPRQSGGSKFGQFALLAGGLGAASGLGLLGSGAGTAGAAGSVGGAGSVASPASTLASAAGGGGAALSNASAGLGAASAGGLGGFLGNNAGALVAGLGGLAGAMDQAPDSYTDTSSIDPAVKPQILDYMQTARERMDRDANHLQNAGYSAIQGAAGDQGLLNQAQSSLGQFMGGGARNPYSGSNPYLEGMIGRASNDVVDRFHQAVGGRDAQFANANAFGGSAYQQSRQQDEKQLQQSLGDIQNQFRFQDYGQQAQLAENQLGRQMQATMFSPSMDAARYTAGNQLLNAGDNRAGWQQQGWNNYANSMNTGMGIGSQNTQANPYQTNRLSSALGGALGAYQIFKGFGS